eukprot:jgi/Tetstr1/427696/TSEL_017821.t1
MSMETAVPIEFQEAWAEAQRCVNERVVAAVEADDRRTDADLFAALLVGTAHTVVALVEDGEFSRAAGRLSSKGMGDLSDPAILAHLRDKHPSRSHPIPNAAYDIPVDEAALTVDMRVPYQQLKQHVAAGPSGIRNEYLRCLVGEYASASGPASSGMEAERRAAERAVVDNMKEAYVSVLAPSQLGVGIPAGDSMLIHGVRLIAERLGPRAVIVHTDLRNAYNEAWRRTIIQRHIDCSPLHPVIPALLASLSTDSYLVVDDRSAPLRSEDGVQQGAPLATTSFCVAIHPEHVWPALHAFRKSIKASVGLEVRFDKMQAYNADMEAARREAPADIEWPELDGHHGIAVLNVPLGSPEYVHAYMRGKAEELREEVEAFAEAVDATVLAAVERVLGVSFDPSTYGTDTNLVVTDFLAELLHDPDPMAAKLQRNFSARRYDHFLNDAHGSDSYAVEMREAWARLQAATADGHLGDADARVMEREVEAASGSQKELTAFLG